MKDKFLHIDSTSLAEQQEFIAWVKYGTNADQWKNWLKSHPQSYEGVEEAKKIVNVLKFAPSAHVVDKQRLWERIEESTDGTIIELSEGYNKVRKLYRISLGAIAASFLLLFALMPLLRQNTLVTAGVGESITLVLPDNSQIYLNADSEIKYREKGWDKGRKVELEGEAFFEVEKGSTFTVLTDNGKVQVLGTKFNVFSRNEVFEVKCTEGRVKVTNKNERASKILQAGDVVKLNDTNEFESKPFQAKFDWRKSAYTYNIVPLRDVFAEIERQFDVEINASPQIMSMSFTGVLETKKLDKALHMATWSMRLSYEISGNKIEIERIQ